MIHRGQPHRTASPAALGRLSAVCGPRPPERPGGGGGGGGGRLLMAHMLRVSRRCERSLAAMRASTTGVRAAAVTVDRSDATSVLTVRLRGRPRVVDAAVPVRPRRSCGSTTSPPSATRTATTCATPHGRAVGAQRLAARRSPQPSRLVVAAVVTTRRLSAVAAQPAAPVTCRLDARRPGRPDARRPAPASRRSAIGQAPPAAGLGDVARRQPARRRGGRRRPADTARSSDGTGVGRPGRSPPAVGPDAGRAVDPCDRLGARSAFAGVDSFPEDYGLRFRADRPRRHPDRRAVPTGRCCACVYWPLEQRLAGHVRRRHGRGERARPVDSAHGGWLVVLVARRRRRRAVRRGADVPRPAAGRVRPAAQRRGRRRARRRVVRPHPLPAGRVPRACSCSVSCSACARCATGRLGMCDRRPPGLQRHRAWSSSRRADEPA